MLFLALLTVFLTVPVLASPLTAPNIPATLALAGRLNVTGVASIVQADRERAKLLQSKASGTAHGVGRRSVFPVPITNEAVSYSVQAGIGSPPTTYTLFVDTSSAITWIGAGKPYVRTSTSVDTGQAVTVDADSSALTGEGFFDTVTLGDMVVPHQFIVVVNQSPAIGFDGALGVGSIDSEDASNPSIANNAFSHGLLTAEEVGIYFQPTTSLSVTNGELAFGGVDSSKINGSLHTVSITSSAPSSMFIGIDQEITYGPSNVILANTAGIVDAGTTLVLIASDAFSRYRAATGGVLDAETGLLKITAAQFANLQSLFFDIGGVRYGFTSNAQIWPHVLNTAIGGDAGSIYLVVSDIGSTSGTGLDFINGFAFLERFYTVYNSETPSFGIAETFFTFATSN